MNYEVIVSESAETETQEAYLWLLGVSPEFAGQWYDGLLDTIASLGTFPKRCPFAPENEDFPDIEVRHLIYRQGRTIYRILYCILEPTTIRVLHVRHGARRYGSFNLYEE